MMYPVFSMKLNTLFVIIILESIRHYRTADALIIIVILECITHNIISKIKARLQQTR